MPKTKKVDINQSVAIVGLINGPLWIHTQGMDKFGFPELEIVGMPRLLYPGAAHILNEVADYMVNGDKPIAIGERMQLGAGSMPSVFQFVLSPGQEGEETYYSNNSVWRLIDPPEGAHRCAACEAGEHGHLH